jgi:hypothetical protein
MRIEEVLQSAADGSRRQIRLAAMLYDFVQANLLASCLFICRTPSIAMACAAAAVAIEADRGSFIVISSRPDNSRLLAFEALLERTGLSQLVTIYSEPSSCHWRLMNFLRSGSQSSFDFIYIEGCTTWQDLSFTCCLAELLLKQGGWIVVDNLLFTFRESRSLDRRQNSATPSEQRSLAQVKAVFKLLVEGNTNFYNFRYLEDVGFARRCTLTDSSGGHNVHLENVALGRAASRARVDPEFRVTLLQCPAEAFVLSGEAELIVTPVHFSDSKFFIPIPDTIGSDGVKTIYIERAPWERTVSEEKLTRMLSNDKS